MTLNPQQLDAMANIAKRPEFKAVPFVAMLRALVIAQWQEELTIEILNFALTYPNPVSTPSPVKETN